MQLKREKGKKKKKEKKGRARSSKSIVSFKIEKLWSKVKKVSIIVNLFLTIGKGFVSLGVLLLKFRYLGQELVIEIVTELVDVET